MLEGVRTQSLTAPPVPPQGFGLPVAGSVAVSPELDEPSAPRGSVAGRGGWPSRDGVRWFSVSVSRVGGRFGSAMEDSSGKRFWNGNA